MDRETGPCMSLSREIHRYRAVARHEDVLAAHRLAARRAHAEGLPVVHHFVFRPVQQAQEVVDGLVTVADNTCEHAPVRVVRARGKVPLAGQHDPAVGRAPAALVIRDAGGNPRVRIASPDFLLRFWIPPREVTVMRGEVGDDPARRDVAAREHFGDIEVGHERQLHSAPHPGLEIAQEPGAVQRVEDRRSEAARLLALWRLFAQERNQFARTPQRFLIRYIRKSRGAVDGVQASLSIDILREASVAPPRSAHYACSRRKNVALRETK